MRGLVLILTALLATTPMAAAPARVTSGEHEGFTRLVIELDEAADWTVGRTDDGYELRIDGQTLQYDLSAAFKIIGRSRVAALSADEASGALRVAIGCNCHVAPFEFRPGTIVMDLKDGPPPAQSPFEAALDGVEKAKPAEPAMEMAEINVLSTAWVDQALGQKSITIAAPLPVSEEAEQRPISAEAEDVPLPEPADEPSDEIAMALPMSPLLDPGLAPLHDELMREISRGAAQGVVAIDLPKDTEIPQARMEVAAGDQSRVGLGSLAGLRQMRIEGKGIGPADLAPQGAQCPSDEQLEVAIWGDERPIWEQISEARAGLSGEFDRPDPEAIGKAIKFYLFIGFGQEALGLIKGFDPDSEEVPLWSSLAHILDDIREENPVFSGMENCDSAGALWAILANPVGTQKPTNFRAVQRSFSALPANLRRMLGPRLIERLMAMDEGDSVDVVSNAIRRAGTGDDRGIALMEAGVAAEAGAFDKADDLLQPLLDDPGPQTEEALVAKIEGQAVRGLPLPPEILSEIEAYASERDGGPEGPKFQRALILALALTGDFRRAFDEAPPDPALQADLWRLLASLGTDDVILEQAAIAKGTAAPAEAQAVASDLAERFLTVGLPDQAQTWLAGAKSVDRVLAARIALAVQDGPSALKYLEGMEGEEAEAMRIAGLVLSGDDLAAAAAFSRAGDEQSASRALARARDWSALGREGQAEWQQTALELTSPAADGTAGPLAEATALADQALGTRDAVRALLAAVPRVE